MAKPRFLLLYKCANALCKIKDLTVDEVYSGILGINDKFKESLSDDECKILLSMIKDMKEGN